MISFIEGGVAMNIGEVLLLTDLALPVLTAYTGRRGLME